MHRSASLLGAALLLLVALGLLPACKKADVAPKSPAGPQFTGPRFLYGTVGSLASLRGYEPMLVSGYGLVVNLEGTGSASSPAFLREWMINEMRKKGLGSARHASGELTPEKVLASEDTALVRVEGLIPPGAMKGDPFDLLVTALPQTQTTSLRGGRLWSTELSINGANERLVFTKALAKGNGPIYTNPFVDEEEAKRRQTELNRLATVLSGGVVADSRSLDLILNQPSWQRSRLIADRINERFPANPSVDRKLTAVAKTNTRIELNIPDRYRGQSQRLMELIQHLYTQRAGGPTNSGNGAAPFEQQKAAELAGLLEASPEDHARAVSLCWETMGKPVLPVIRSFYDHENLEARMAGLQAGAHLQDAQAVQPLAQLAEDRSLPAVRRRHVASLLGRMERNLTAGKVLVRMLGDPDRSVRVAAYEGLIRLKHLVIRRRIFAEADPGREPNLNRFKFILDLVPLGESEGSFDQRQVDPEDLPEPMIYITQARVPRIAVFGYETGFTKEYFSTRLWDNRLQIQSEPETDTILLFYQGHRSVKGQSMRTKPDVANLIFALAHSSSPRSPEPGLNRSYDQVVNVLHLLEQRGLLEGPIVLQDNPLVQAVEMVRQASEAGVRPETEHGLDAPQLPEENRYRVPGNLEREGPSEPEGGQPSPNRARTGPGSGRDWQAEARALQSLNESEMPSAQP